MKNIFLFPTDKPSRLGFDSVKNLHFVNDYIDDYQNIYITSDEEIKEGDCVCHTQMFNHIGFTGIAKVGKQQVNQEFEMTSLDGHYSYYSCKEPKVILTTDQELIADGIEQISEDVLLKIVEHINSGKNIESFDEL